MAITIQVDGPALIKIASPAAGSLDSLGYTENGADIEEQLFPYNVVGDQNGGDAGPPIDIQYMGEMHRIRLLLTTYDEAILNKIRAGLAGGTAGTPGTAGTLYFQDTKAFRLLIHTTNRPRNYGRVVFTEAKSINKGTKHSKALVTALAYKDGSGVLYDATTT